jgi:hypothetical protein
VSITTVTFFSVSTLPTSSVEKNSTTCAPSFEWSPGAGITTAAPAWRLPPSTRYEITLTPEPVPSSAEKLTVTGALLGEPGASDGVVVGAVWSTSTVTVPDVKELPALSVVVTRRSYGPSATASGPDAVSQGAGVAVHVPAPAGLRSKTTVATPEPASAESPVSATGATPISAPLAGAVTEPVGLVLSTRIEIVADVKALPALSVVVTRRS